MKERWKNNWTVPFFLFLLAAICLLTVVLSSNQSSLSKPQLQTFTGEYSRDGETWYPLDDNADLNALDGDLLLRGHFGYDSINGGGSTTTKTTSAPPSTSTVNCCSVTPYPRMRRKDLP